MQMFWHLYTFRLKVLAKNRSLLFWTLAFPILLGLLFSMAFGEIDEINTIKTSQVAIVSQDAERSESFTKVLTNIGEEDTPLFTVKELSAFSAKKKLTNNQIAGYFVVSKDELELFVGRQGIPQTILQRVQATYLQKEALIKELLSSGRLTPEEIAGQAFSQEDHIKVKKHGTNFSLKSFYFFTLVGMTLLYGFMWGLKNSSDQQANQSANGIRLDMSPQHKLLISTANLLAAFTLFIAIVGIILSVYSFVYQVDFGNRWPQIGLLAVMGSLTALAFGTLLGSLLKDFTENQKIGLGVSVTMAMSFLAGMMGSQGIKYQIDEHFPLLGKLNIVNLISESLYQLFYYRSLGPFYQNLLWLGGFLVIFMVGNYFVERKAQYDYL